MLDQAVNSNKVFAYGEQSYRATTAACKILVFHYSVYNPNTTNKLNDHLKVEVIELENSKENNPLMSFSYSKANHSPVGNFSFSLLPTKNWTQYIRPGDWILAYLTNNKGDYFEGNNLRCLGIVTSITSSDSIGGGGERQVRYQVVGEDFGRVFANFDIWVNPWAPEALAPALYVKYITGAIQGNPGEVVSQLVDFFLGHTTSAEVSADTRSLEQWYVPYYLDYVLKTGISPNLLEKIGSFLDGGLFSAPMKFPEILIKNIQKDVSGKWMIYKSGVDGKLWDTMMQFSNPGINEMFCELDDVNYSKPQPALYLRTVPFTWQGSKIDPSENYFLDLPSVDVGGSDIFSIVTNFNDNQRISMIIMDSMALEAFVGSGVKTSLAYLAGHGYPKLLLGMNRRHGLVLKRLSTIYSLTAVKVKKNGVTEAVLDYDLLLRYNKMIQRWYEGNPFYENVQISMIGDPKVRLGKRISVKNSPSLWGGGLSKGDYKSYYIESYEDVWQFGQPWVQRIVGTRGVVVSGNKEYFVHDKYSSDDDVIGTTIVKKDS